jgi:hypothetical protein
MPRLRRVQKEKYGDFEHSDLIDSDVQSDIINNLKARVDVSTSRNARVLFRVYLLVLLTVNMALIMVPYYRKGINSIFSALACVMMFIPIVLVYSTIYSVEDIHVQFVRDIRTTSACALIYGTIIAVKFWKYTSWENIHRDIIYLIPLFIGICVLDFYRDNSRLSNAIGELDTLRYDYKEA